MKLNKILKQEKIKKKIKHIINKGYFHNHKHHDCLYIKYMNDMEIFGFDNRMYLPQKEIFQEDIHLLL